MENTEENTNEFVRDSRFPESEYIYTGNGRYYNKKAMALEHAKIIKRIEEEDRCYDFIKNLFVPISDIKIYELTDRGIHKLVSCVVSCTNELHLKSVENMITSFNKIHKSEILTKGFFEMVKLKREKLDGEILPIEEDVAKAIPEQITKFISVSEKLPPFGKKVLWRAIIAWKSTNKETYFDDILTQEEEGLDYGTAWKTGL